jgi:hypothetical protein
MWAMGSIILLAFGACFFPTLLACVAIMISRPEPRWLLIAFYAGGVVTSVSAGIVVLAVFESVTRCWAARARTRIRRRRLLLAGWRSCWPG